MSNNPYAPPATSGSIAFSADSTNDELAGRFTRFAAALVDGLLMMAIIGPVMFATGYFQRAQTQQAGPLEILGMSLLGVGVMLAFNGYFLFQRGQTIGKILTKIQIVDAQDGKLLPFLRVYVYRYLWMTPIVLVVAFIPGATDDLLVNVLGLIDSLLIFGGERRRPLFHGLAEA